MLPPTITIIARSTCSYSITLVFSGQFLQQLGDLLEAGSHCSPEFIGVQTALRKCANNLIRILNRVKVSVLFKYFPWTVTQAVCAGLTLMFVSMIIFLVFQTPELRPCDQSSVGVTRHSMTSHHLADWGLILTRVRGYKQIHRPVDLWSRNR